MSHNIVDEGRKVVWVIGEKEGFEGMWVDDIGGTADDEIRMRGNRISLMCTKVNREHDLRVSPGAVRMVMYAW